MTQQQACERRDALLSMYYVPTILPTLPHPRSKACSGELSGSSVRVLLFHYYQHIKQHFHLSPTQPDPVHLWEIVPFKEYFQYSEIVLV